MIAKCLVIRGIRYLVLQYILVGFYHKSIVIFVGWLLAGHVLLGYQYTQAHRFALKVDGVAGGEVAAPTAAQTLMVGKLLRTLYVNHTGRESVVAHVGMLLGEIYFYIGVAMTGVLDVA